MRYMLTYDLMESMRVTNQWMGASVQAMCSYPALGLVANPAIQLAAAWGEVTERSFARMVAKPDWGIYSFAGEDGRDPVVKVYTTITGRYAPWHQTVITGTAGEAIHALDGILGHDSSVDVSALHVDGGGASDIVFAIMSLLGLNFEPRIPRLSDRRLYAFEPVKQSCSSPAGNRPHRTNAVYTTLV